MVQGFKGDRGGEADDGRDEIAFEGGGSCPVVNDVGVDDVHDVIDYGFVSRVEDVFEVEIVIFWRFLRKSPSPQHSKMYFLKSQ